MLIGAYWTGKKNTPHVSKTPNLHKKMGIVDKKARSKAEYHEKIRNREMSVFC